MSNRRVPQSAQRYLDKAKRAANFERASFDVTREELLKLVNQTNLNGFGRVDVTDFIRETTRLYRESWVDSAFAGFEEWASGEVKATDYRFKRGY